MGENKDRDLLIDILRAAAKLLAQDALRQRVGYLGFSFGHSQYCSEKDYLPTLNAAARCELLAQRYEKMP